MELLDIKTVQDEKELTLKVKINDDEKEVVFAICLKKPINLIHASEALKALARKIDGIYLDGLELDKPEYLDRDID